VTGAEGMLGSDLCSVLGETYEVRGVDIADFDIADSDDVAMAVDRISPAVIVHAAAFTNVDACEDEREKALRVNTVGTENMARAASKAGSRLVYISTDYVFSGSKRKPYVETDTPAPINYYGLTKFNGEKLVRELASRHLVVRTSWLFGPNGKNFVDTIIEKAYGAGRLQVVDDQRGCPTYTCHLAAGLRAVIDKGLEGTVHLTNSGNASWYDLARYVVETAGIDTEIDPVDTTAWPTRARRPAYTVLASEVLAGAGIEPLPPWEQGVRAHLARRGMLKNGGRT
jgi:dTDP-4-dehydrorhamnose reductase